MSKGYPNGLHLKKKTIVHAEKNSRMFEEFGFRGSSLGSLRCLRTLRTLRTLRKTYFHS